ncbi:lysine exporter LysO family protein [Acinetobacter rathckeae]|uniref:lysine exporter LysO family protein n=1 Tax=Acinetobacter rathckeae TaxID=2605272 RepID=UPI0018A286C1|nr:lysine exporter LysO family protein [Acinetobacter rathckeae]MBF7688693.1 lysine exporter LysO family protein [Acinetobacter rathckeae]MBF7696086.1 lysine exporter LysO family protein [Acinetobacter rathckeae]
MLILLLNAVWPITCALLLGWLIGKTINTRIHQYFSKSIGYFIWLLLVSVGMQFGEVLANPKTGLSLVGSAMLYAGLLSVVTFVVLIPFQSFDKHASDDSTASFKDIVAPIKACCLAVLMVVIGGILYFLLPNDIRSVNVSGHLLYLVIFMIGAELSTVKIERITKQHLYVPFMALLVWPVVAWFLSFFYSQDTLTLMMLGGGLGWFSLSGSLVAELTQSNQLGGFALLTDLFREIFSIIFIYLFGRRFSLSALGVCGATAMDSTLPFVKKNCTASDVQIAIFSGFILSILAPFLIIICASLR